MPLKDPAAAPEKILSAALGEFSEHGFSGARTDAIARRAGVNKQLLYYYFGNKEELYREVLLIVHQQFEDWIDQSPVDPIENLTYWQKIHSQDTTYLRLMLWEGLQPPPGPRLVAEEIRRAFYAKSAKRLQLHQGPGGWPEGLKAEQALLSWIAIIIAPFAMPHLARLLTGKSPHDATFLEERETFLKGLGGILQEASPPAAATTAEEPENDPIERPI